MMQETKFFKDGKEVGIEINVLFRSLFINLLSANERCILKYKGNSVCINPFVWNLNNSPCVSDRALAWDALLQCHVGAKCLKESTDGHRLKKNKEYTYLLDDI